MSRLPDLSEDRGDGRSRHHALHLDVCTVLHLTVQRDGDRYVATATRLGMAYPAPFVSCDGATLDEAVEAAARAVGCKVTS